jgi:hypothetical protein
MIFRGVLIVLLAVAVGAVIITSLDEDGEGPGSNETAQPTGPTPPFEGGAVPPGLHVFGQFAVPLSMAFGDGWIAPFAPDGEKIVLEGPVFLAISHPTMVVDADSGEFAPLPEDLITWVGTHKNFDASAPTETTLGGRPAFLIDATAREGTKTLAFGSVDAILVARGDRMRMIVADVDGETLAVTMIAAPAEFDAKVASAKTLLDTLRFEEANSTDPAETPG